MARYRVLIEKRERYSHQVCVDADSPREAERIVCDMNNYKEFDKVWDELRPTVVTSYEAEEI